ncbi:MAG: TerC/Alx family metal homeostasis membrane protein [Gemmatimonadaceae bacterium]|nr:TerC/Alx family metal homeostasis membrane protein [Chitinophagaceae bacterium]
MTAEQITYLVFGIVLVIALIFDLGLLSKSSQTISTKKALTQTIFWVSLAVAFGVYVWFQDGKVIAIEYISAYLMEWSLSIDNIFVFILIFSFFGIRESHYARVLLIGILMAILLRIAFISVGIELVQRFDWILYVFGVFLVITGVKMFAANKDEEVKLEENFVYKILKKILPLTSEENGSHLTVVKNGKRFYTRIFVVIVMLATTDVIFAVDSIPAVFAISQKPLVIYTSNIFAVLGLRSLFFLLKGAVNKFSHLQQGIAIVLVFIGLKMLVVLFDIHVPVYISLIMIIVCLVTSILYSLQIAARQVEKEKENQELKD